MVASKGNGGIHANPSECTCGPVGYDGYDGCRQNGCDDDCPVCGIDDAEVEVYDLTDIDLENRCR